MAIEFAPKNLTNNEVEKLVDYKTLEAAIEVIKKYRPNLTGYPTVTIIEMDMIKSEIERALFAAYLAEAYPDYRPNVRIVK